MLGGVGSLRPAADLQAYPPREQQEQSNDEAATPNRCGLACKLRPRLDNILLLLCLLTILTHRPNITTRLPIAHCRWIATSGVAMKALPALCRGEADDSNYQEVGRKSAARSVDAPLCHG